MKRAIAVILLITLVSSFSSVAAVIWPEQTPGLPYETHVYEPFGADFDDIGVPILGDQDIRYTGKPFDASTGKHYFNARYLNTITDTASPGLPPRFLTPDIIEGTPGNPQSRNRYASCLNDPVGYVDPDGKDIIPAKIVSGNEFINQIYAIQRANPTFNAEQVLKAWNMQPFEKIDIYLATTGDVSETRNSLNSIDVKHFMKVAEIAKKWGSKI